MHSVPDAEMADASYSVMVDNVVWIGDPDSGGRKVVQL